MILNHNALDMIFLVNAFDMIFLVNTEVGLRIIVLRDGRLIIECYNDSLDNNAVKKITVKGLNFS
jgi:hypothetical protein